jgi:hypothetical protein
VFSASTEVPNKKKMILQKKSGWAGRLVRFPWLSACSVFVAVRTALLLCVLVCAPARLREPFRFPLGGSARLSSPSLDQRALRGRSLGFVLHALAHRVGGISYTIHIPQIYFHMQATYFTRYVHMKPMVVWSSGVQIRTNTWIQVWAHTGSIVEPLMCPYIACARDP